MSRSRFITVLAACALALLAASVVGGCSPRAAELDPPAQAVQNALELRYERSSDASAYADVFASADLAVALAQDATASVPPTRTGPPIPEWDPPYVSAQTSGTADVVVQWRDDADFPEWPTATLFNLEFLSEMWKIVDAQELTGTAPPELDSPETTQTP